MPSISNRAKLVILSLSFVLVSFAVLGGLNLRAAAKGDGAYKQITVYSEVLARIRSAYVEEPNLPAVTEGSLRGLLESLDANSSYLSPEEYKAYKARKSDGKAGIGASVSKRFGYAVAVSVMPGGAADKATVQNGDILEAIEGKSTRDLSLAEIRSLLSGQVGSTVSVSVVRTQRVEPQKLTITRELEVVPPATDKMMEDNVGYIKVDALTKGKAQEIAGKIKSLQHNGAKKLLLDLRNVAEGDEAEGVAAANLFLNHGVIAYLEGQKVPRETFTADPQKAITTLPLAVLVNHFTAGPAEVVAAAVLDNARGDVVGDKTFGDGSVQKLLDVPNGGALILSVAKYHAPSGKVLEDVAVTPNVLVTEADTNVALDEDGNPIVPEPKNAAPKPDDQLLRALETLKKRT